jgi:hypothetical protein
MRFLKSGLSLEENCFRRRLTAWHITEEDFTEVRNSNIGIGELLLKDGIYIITGFSRIDDAASPPC